MQKPAQMFNPNSCSNTKHGKFREISAPHLPPKNAKSWSSVTGDARPSSWPLKPVRPAVSTATYSAVLRQLHAHACHSEFWSVRWHLRVCEEKRVLVWMQGMIQGPRWYAVRNLMFKPIPRVGWTLSLVDLLGYNLLLVYNCLFNVGAGDLTKVNPWIRINNC